MSKILSTIYFLLSTILVVYSYGYLDFNLTLSSHPFFLKFVTLLQNLVYFNRPFSVKIYIFIFLAFFVISLILLIPKIRPANFPWKIFLICMLIIWLSYPMLSYDIFNYMFHGKILWLYGSNPHSTAPLVFEGDLWLRFMRWIHTPSAYGPVFTLIESPAYLLGFGKFVPVLYLMKATMISFYVWSVYLTGLIMKQLNKPKSTIILSQLLLAFNPFLWLELVVNAHNDAVMIALLLYAIYASLKHNQIKSFLSLMLSVGVKYVTVVTTPFFLLKNKQIKITLITLSLLLPILLSPGRFQPWYLIWPLIPAALIDAWWARIWIITTSLAGLAYYPVYIATGFWNLSELHRLVLIYSPTLFAATYATYLKKSI
ncbi:MAG: hypothetical protein Fur0011_6150 [Candidatus Microgenomates bacterium]